MLVSCSKDPMDIILTEKNYYQIIDKISKNSSAEDKEEVLEIVTLISIAQAFSKDTDKTILPDDFKGKSFRQIIKELDEASNNLE